MEQINDILSEFLSYLSNFVWGGGGVTGLLISIVPILLLTGLWLTLRTMFIQLRGFKHGVGIASGKYDDPEHKGQLTHFQALSAALSATIGIGNIAGVAIAIYHGGPGAIFWMWVSAFFGMAIKYSECMLAIKYRKVEKDGNIRGGPMYFLDLGFKGHWRWYFLPLAYLFAFCTAIAAFGSGNMAQSNTLAHSLVEGFEVGESKTTVESLESPYVRSLIADFNVAANDVRADLTDSLARENLASAQTELLAVKMLGVAGANGSMTYYIEDDIPWNVDDDGRRFVLRVGIDPLDVNAISVVDEAPVGTWRWIIGILLATLVGVVIIGGIKRIGRVASVLVPFMSVVYVLSAMLVLVLKYDQIIPALQLIFHHAFHPTAVVGGSAAGVTIWLTISWGLRRGLFSNEAGQGSAAMAHSTAKVDEPVREGLVAMLGPFIDTIVICTMTALVILTSGLWASGETSVALTMSAFNAILPIYGKWMVVVGVLLFAFSTVLAWSYYGEKGIEYLLGRRAKLPYKWLFIVFTLLGARLDLEAVWAYADTANGMMALPNLVALIGLSGVVVGLTKKYMDEKKRDLHLPYEEMLRRKKAGLPPGQ